MASSVARMPVASFKDRLHRPRAVFSCSGFGEVEAAREGGRPSPPSSPCSSCSDASSAAVERSPTCCSGTGRRSRVLERWFENKTRGMAITVERQTHEAELSLLSAAIEPVSARAATFLHREPSPTATGVMSSPPAPPLDGQGEVGDLPRNFRASSLIQRWKEIEADAQIVSSPRVSTGGITLSEIIDGNFPSTEEPCGRSECYDDYKNRPRCANGVKEQSWGSAKENSLEIEAQSSSIHYVRETEPSAHGRSPLCKPNDDRGLLKETAPQLRRRRNVDDLLPRMIQERKQELDRLMDRHPVSKFSHRSRIQSLLRFRVPDRLLMFQHQRVPNSTALELDSLRQRGSIFCSLRERYDSRCKGGNHLENGEGIDVFLQHKSLRLDHTLVPDHSTSISPIATTNDSETIFEENLSLTISDDIQDDSQTSVFSWQEKNIQTCNVDWQRGFDSSSFDNLDGDLALEESDFSRQNIVENTSVTWPTLWENSRRMKYQEVNENYHDSAEIQELLQRKPVSTSLSSNFRDVMERMVLSLLKRQKSIAQSIGEEEVDHVEKQNYGFSYTDRTGSSPKVMPLTCRTFHSPSSRQDSCLTDQSSNRYIETELVHDLRNDISELHHEMAALRKSVEICMDEQAKLQNFIRDEFSSVVHKSVGIALLLNSSGRAQAKTGSCCVCYEMPVDSLLYRCGHMCTCFKCAQELRWGTGRCPICREEIIDAVKTLRDTSGPSAKEKSTP